MGRNNQTHTPKIRYAVVGQGHIAQVAVLPAFAHAKANSELTALVSDDPVKLKKLGRKYGVRNLYSYAQYEACLASGEVDDVYIALPNHLHAEYSERALRCGVHVLCEKPMAISSDQCRRMIDLADQHEALLMIAYRLHFEEANLAAVRVARSGRIGQLRLFHSVFTMPVREGNIRVQADKGGGPLFDIGIYCINASRYLFQDEPESVIAERLQGHRKPFDRVEEAMSVVLRFAGERLATFTCSFGAAPTGWYQLVGTKGDLILENAYAYEGTKILRLTHKNKTSVRKFPVRDQFAPELLYFSRCIQRQEQPEPSGREGLSDLQIIEAIFESSRQSTPVALELVPRKSRPTPKLAIRRPPVESPETIHVVTPAKDEAA